VRLGVELPPEVRALQERGAISCRAPEPQGIETGCMELRDERRDVELVVNGVPRAGVRELKGEMRGCGKAAACLTQPNPCGSEAAKPGPGIEVGYHSIRRRSPVTWAVW
jgi:hypothetical protein